MLDDLPGLIETLREHPDILIRRAMRSGTIHCAVWGADRRPVVQLVYRWEQPRTRSSRASLRDVTIENPPGPTQIEHLSDEEIVDSLAPAIFRYTCHECDNLWTALLYHGPDTKTELAVFANHRGGLSTLHTPDGVAFYLDQAHRAQSVGAHSAAVVMYRSALEHLLFEQGYTNGTCGVKVSALKADIAKGQAPSWTHTLDPQLLVVMTKLGNAAAHPNDGDVTKQAVLDSKLLIPVKAAFAELLEKVYEQPIASSQRLADLEAALATFEADEPGAAAKG
jgi:hypothetical protein